MDELNSHRQKSRRPCWSQATRTGQKPGTHQVTNQSLMVVEKAIDQHCRARDLAHTHRDVCSAHQQSRVFRASAWARFPHFAQKADDLLGLVFHDFFAIFASAQPPAACRHCHYSGL
mgnify:CR=1 FL=1